LVTADVSSLAHVAATLLKTTEVSIPVQENAGNFVDAHLQKSGTSNYLGIMEPHRRKVKVKSVSISDQHQPRFPPNISSFVACGALSLHQGRAMATSTRGCERPCPNRVSSTRSVPATSSPQPTPSTIFFYILRCGFDKTLIYNRNGFLMATKPTPHKVDENGLTTTIAFFVDLVAVACTHLWTFFCRNRSDSVLTS
jgi:hypothetical protein